MPIARNIKRQINALCVRNSGIDFILQPILGDLSLHALDVPRKPAAEIAAASRKSEATLGAARSHAVGAGNRAALTIENLVGDRRLELGLALGIRLHRRG